MAGKLASVRAHRSLVAAKYPKMAVQLRPVPICKPVGRGKISFSHPMTVLDGTRESPGSATGLGGRGGGGACEIMTKKSATAVSTTGGRNGVVVARQ